MARTREARDVTFDIMLQAAARERHAQQQEICGVRMRHASSRQVRAKSGERYDIDRRYAQSHAQARMMRGNTTDIDTVAEAYTRKSACAQARSMMRRAAARLAARPILRRHAQRLPR